MAKIIIGIHGLGNKPPADLLEKWWMASIKEGLKRANHHEKEFNFKLVYWADILHVKAENPAITDKDNEFYITEPYTPSKNKPAPEIEKSLSSRILQYIEEQLDNIFLKDDMTLNFSSVTDRIIHNYFEDLEVYYSNTCTQWDDPKCLARPAICNRLFKVLQKYKKNEIMLIAHSMGSIVAYDVLINHLDELKVDTFITVGSPLGLPIIISRIFAEQKDKLRQNQLAAPENILKKWINISDPEDLVAMDHTLKDDFLANKRGVRAEDLKVYNDYVVDEKRNPHKIYGYLRCEEMIGLITEFIKKEEKNYLWDKYHRLRKILQSIIKPKKKK